MKDKLDECDSCFNCAPECRENKYNEGVNMNRTIKFSHNWNNKLGCNVFTTIRKFTPDKFKYYASQEGEVFKVALNNKDCGTAVLRQVWTKSFDCLPKNGIALDVGYCDTKKQNDIFSKFGITGGTPVIVLAFERLNPKTHDVK